MQDSQLVFSLGCKQRQSKFPLAQNFESKNGIRFTLPILFFQMTFIHLPISSRPDQFPEIILFLEVCDPFFYKLLCLGLCMHHSCKVTLLSLFSVKRVFYSHTLNDKTYRCRLFEVKIKVFDCRACFTRLATISHLNN